MPERFELQIERVVERPYEPLEAALREGPERWLPGYRKEGELVSGELAYEQGGRRVRRRIAVEIAPVQRFAYGVTVHVRWKAAQHAALYPWLEGHLRLERRPPSGSTLRFSARYQPPGGRVGAAADTALMHHVAEASVSDFVAGVAERLAGA